MTLDPVIVAIACSSSVAVFAGSAAAKFAAPDEFRGAVENYRIAPELMAGAIAWIVPSLELIAAAGLLFAETRAAAVALLLVLLTMFTGAIGLNLARGRREIDCGCFGPMLRQQLSGWLVVRNLVLAILVVCASGRIEVRTLMALDYATIAGAAIALIVLYAAANYLLANAPFTAALRVRDA
jgi:hypothetical protein